jgi:hypothetical protein
VSSALSVASDNADYMRRFREKQDEITTDANTARTGFTERMAELVQMQQAEILRLQGVLHDNTVLPDRYAAIMAVSSAVNKDGRVDHVLLATANDGSIWLMENYSPNGNPRFYRWGRVPALPQASDEADAPR